MTNKCMNGLPCKQVKITGRRPHSSDFGVLVRHNLNGDWTRVIRVSDERKALNVFNAIIACGYEVDPDAWFEKDYPVAGEEK